MRRILTSLMLCVAALAAAAQPPSGGVDSVVCARLAALSTAYTEQPDDVEALHGLALFYFDNSNPMRNLPLAMQFATAAEQQYVQMLEGDKLKEMSRLMKKDITLATLRQSRKAIYDAAANMVRLRDDLSEQEVDLYLDAFDFDRELTNRLRQRRIGLANEAALAEGTPEAYYRFAEAYPGTNEAEQMEQRLASLAASLFADAEAIDAVDSIARRYRQSPSVARAAERRRSAIAFAQASRQGTIEAYNAFLQRYPSSDENMTARERLDALTGRQYASLHSARDYASFAERNPYDALSDDAVATLRHRILHSHDIEAARLYLAKFKDDPAYGDIYNLYYSWHAAEGNSAPIRRFAAAHPDYPAWRAVEDDLERARGIDRISLMDDYIDVRFDTYADALRENMDRRIALVILQRMLQTKLPADNRSEALARVQQFDLCFDNTCHDEYAELVSLLTAPTSAPRPSATFGGAGMSITHPALNAADGRLYFTATARHDKPRIYTATHTGIQWTDVREVTFSDVPSAGLTFYGFCNDGATMLLGHDGDIWMAERDGEVWRVTDIPPYPVNSDYIEADAFMLPDGSGMLLASDRPGGYNLQASGDYFHGDTALASDLYFVPFSKGLWGEAVNLGPVVNSAYCERSPLLSRNGKTLYFVTDSRGLGYGDIYVATRNNSADWTAWSTPRNLGCDVNSPFDEASVTFSPDERSLYLASNVGGGRYAAYTVAAIHDTAANTTTRKLDLGLLKGYVNRVRLVDSDRSAIVQQVDVPEAASAVELDISAGHNYLILADAGSYYVPAFAATSPTLSLRGYTFDELAGSDRSLPLPAIAFDGAHLTPAAVLQLEQLAHFLSQADTFAVELIVSVEGRDDERCYDLSLQRGAALRTCLVASGIDADNIIVSAYGNALAKQGNTTPVSIRIRN